MTVFFFYSNSLRLVIQKCKRPWSVYIQDYVHVGSASIYESDILTLINILPPKKQAKPEENKTPYSKFRKTLLRLKLFKSNY